MRGIIDVVTRSIPQISTSAWKLYKSIGLKIPMDPTKHPHWIAFPTQMFIGFGIGFGLMTFMNLVEVEGKTKPDGTRKVTSFYRLQARQNPEHYLGTIYQF